MHAHAHPLAATLKFILCVGLALTFLGAFWVMVHA
jgi:hypothetical protein